MGDDIVKANGQGERVVGEWYPAFIDGELNFTVDGVTYPLEWECYGHDTEPKRHEKIRPLKVGSKFTYVLEQPDRRRRLANRPKTHDRVLEALLDEINRLN